MSNYNGNGSNNASISLPALPPFHELIEEYLEPNPKEPRKYFCPICGGHNLSLGKNLKWDCRDVQTKEHRQEITQWLNDKLRADQPELFAKKPGDKVVRPQTERQKNAQRLKDADWSVAIASAEINSKIEELAYQYDPAYQAGTLATLTAEIAAWAKTAGHDVYAVKMMLKEKIEFLNPDSSGYGGYTPRDKSGSTSNPYGSKVVNVGSDVSVESNIEELLASVREMRGLEFVGGDRLDPYKLFPAHLADALVRASKVLPCPVEALITPLFAVCSRLIGTSSVVSPKNGWSEPMVFWGMISGITGSMKSTALATITKPMVRLQAQSEFEYARAIEEWKAATVAAAKNNEEFSEPEPLKAEYFIDDASFESVGQAHKENPRGILVLQDEIDAFYAGFNKHRGGKGDDAQRWLPLNGGSPIKVNRLSRKLFVEKTCVAIMGTIQPDTVIPILRDPKNNVSGMNARWNYCDVPFPSPLDCIDDDDAISNLQSILLDLYKKLLTLPGGEFGEDGQLIQTNYLLSKESYELWHQQWMPYIVNLWDREQHQGYKAVLAKQRGFAARNAGLLYLISNAAEGNISPSRFIPLEQTKGGIAIAQFFVNQAKGLYGLAGTESQDQDWTPILMRLKEASLKAVDTDGWITPRDAKRKTRLVTSSDHAKSIFSQMFEAGIGELDTAANTPRWRWTEQVNSDAANPVAKSANVDKLTGDWLSGVAANVAKPVATVATVDKKVDPKNQKLKVGQTITPLKGNFQGLELVVIEIEKSKTTGEIEITLSNNGRLLAMALSTLNKAGYRICEADAA